MRDALSRVFDNPGALRHAPKREHPASMNRGTAHGKTSWWWSHHCVRFFADCWNRPPAALPSWHAAATFASWFH